MHSKSLAGQSRRPSNKRRALTKNYARNAATTLMLRAELQGFSQPIATQVSGIRRLLRRETRIERVTPAFYHPLTRHKSIFTRRK